ncbi:exoribonuclease II [Enterobacteriaceae endosymbiont of Plateumaris consimilis]|uniref:exoribonuclease II n=1 Tax=Enterobacteriaceae endosymbiont of Plateumaris consimilis TaxID=2675794 RepID=UPI001449F075|nr:exoribonuclease II [Enterobacteriaceae endosymbiont of Plateumaris consimilis]QJC28447.1 exoribonuclease II [Enterobacteriaceae endosymbiont of Plateumaris consimilis]
MLNNNKVLLSLKEKFSNKSFLVKGNIKIFNKKFGILETESNQIYEISNLYIKYVIHDDYVIASIKHINNKLVAIPIKLLKSSINFFIGNIKINNNKLFVIPENKLLHNIIIECFSKKNIKHIFQNKEKVIATIVNHPLKTQKNVFIAEILEHITKNNNYLIPWWTILSKYNLEIDPPSDDLCKNIHILDKNLYREDLTDLCFITIDNNDTKDIDDAIFIKEMSEKKLIIYVAIADPTSYISEDSELNKIALKRMFTNYLPGFTVPLLPKFLSENLCSLNPNQTRSALICKMQINNHGILLEQIDFSIAWIQSKAKLSYYNVSNWLENIGNWNPKNNDVKQQILLLYKFYQYRIKWKNKNVLLFNNKDYKFIFNHKGKILNIIIEEKRIAHKIIEETMIAANICAAKILKKKLGFGVYNINNGFNYNKINKVISLLKEYNIECNVSFLINLKGFKKINDKLENLQLLKQRLKKYQLMTIFHVKPAPHFYLGVKCYATWTSPIRKFGDIINHRLLKSIIRKEIINKPSNKIFYLMNKIKCLNKQASKDLSSWLYYKFLKNSIYTKEVFISKIIDILYIGIRVRLIKNGAYAFIPKKFLYPIINEININSEKGLIYIKNKLTFKLCDEIKVIIKEINIDTYNIIVKLAK